MDVVQRQVGAAINVGVEELAVQGSDPLDQGVVHFVELKRRWGLSAAGLVLAAIAFPCTLTLTVESAFTGDYQTVNHLKCKPFWRRV